MATSSEFAQSIKAKYPQYKSMDDTLLTQKVLQKYPQYQSKIAEPKKDGFIKSAVKGIIRPAVNFGRDVAGGTYAANAAAGEMLGRIVDPQNKNKRFDKEIQRGLSFMTPRGREAALDKSAIPTKQVELGVQRGAGAASYLVPGGTTLKSAVGLGAASGALYGASEGDKLSAKSTLAGSAGGAAGGLAGYGLLKGVVKGKGATTALKNKVQNTVADKATQGYNKASPSMFQKAVEEHGIDINELTRKHVLPGADYDTMLGTVAQRGRGGVLGNKMKAAEQVINKEIDVAGSNTRVPIDDFTKSMRAELKSLKGIPGNEANVKALETLIKDTQKLYKKGLTPKKLLEIKRMADSKFGKAVVDENTGSVAAQYQKMLANYTRTKLKTILPKVAGALDEESEIYTLRPVLERARGTANTQGSKIRNGSFTTLTDLASPFAYMDALNTNPKTASKMAGWGVADGAPITKTKLPESLPNRVGLVGTKVGQLAGVGMVNPNPEANNDSAAYGSNNYDKGNDIQGDINHTGIINPMSSTPQQEVLSPGGQWKWDAAANDWVPNAPQQGAQGDVRAQIYQLALKDLEETGGKNFAKLQQLAEFYDYANPVAAAPENKTEGQVARDEIGTLTRDAISQLKATPTIKIGILAGPTENLKAKFDKADPATYTFNITLDQIRGAIAKARAGSAMSPQELALLDAYTPKVGDSRQEVITKLMNLQKNFASNEALF